MEIVFVIYMALEVPLTVTFLIWQPVALYMPLRTLSRNLMARGAPLPDSVVWEPMVLRSYLSESVSKSLQSGE